MLQYRVEFSDGRLPEVLEVEADQEVMQALCEIYRLTPPLIPSRTKGIIAVWLLDGNGKSKRRIWP